MNVAIARTPSGAEADRLTDRIAPTAGLSLVDPTAADVLLAVDDNALRAASHDTADADSRPLLRLPPSDSDNSVADRSTLLEQLATHSPSTLPTTSRQVLSVQADETATRVARDCAIVTTDPARISEYRVGTERTTLTTFRADGVVVATPLGTTAYSRTAGGPRLAPDTGLAVVPVAPFAMTADQWVVRPPLTLRVERDDAVSVLADGRQIASGGAELTVSVSVAGSVTVVDRRCLAVDGRNWKNSNESSPQK